MRTLRLYDVIVAIRETLGDDGKVTRETEKIYDERELATASEVKPINILRRSELAEKVAGIPAEEVLIRVTEVTLSSPFLG